MRAKVVLAAFYFLVAALFLGGVAAGRWTASYPLDRTFGHWDIARNLGPAAEAKGSRSSVAQAFFDPEKALADMDNYLWVPETTPIPLLDFTAAAKPGLPIIDPGFRATTPPQRPKPRGTLRIFLIGGSTAFSVGAPSEAWTIGERLEHHLSRLLPRPVEVFTLATPSWTSTQERAAALNVVAPLEPDLVISLSGVNDFVFAQLGRDPNLTRGHYEQTFFDALSLAHQLTGRGVLHDAVPSSKKAVPIDQPIHRAVENAALIRFGLQRSGSRYLYILQPTLYDASYRTTREQSLLDGQSKEKVAYFRDGYPRLSTAMAAELGELAFLDLTDAFANRPEGTEVFIDAYHFGDRGNDILAKAMAQPAARLLGVPNPSDQDVMNLE